MDIITLIIPAFIAGILTFLAPCTLPLVPAYLSFIGGSSIEDLKDPDKAKRARMKIFLNGLFYVIGFSAVFILLGSLFGLGGSALIQYRTLIARVGGVFIIFFALFLIAPGLASITRNKINLMRLSVFRFFQAEAKLSINRLTRNLRPGNPVSSLIFGATFAFGWTPCVGPILGVILTFAASSATLGAGAMLLLVFSLGLAVPFLLTALAIGWASKHISKLSKYLNAISFIGGLFLLLLGVLMVTDNFLFWIQFIFQLLEPLDYEEWLLDYL
ncbi:MAG: cytochrome c biogenesis protein CcdA [Patescibacteria group bacterium]|nr:cytochrome c biogenesis protein CcdA [Patescibacteria group bacterium]